MGELVISGVHEGLGERVTGGDEGVADADERREGDEAEVVGEEAARGGGGQAVDGAVAVPRGAREFVEVTEETHGARRNAAQRFGEEEEDEVL